MTVQSNFLENDEWIDLSFLPIDFQKIERKQNTPQETHFRVERIFQTRPGRERRQEEGKRERKGKIENLEQEMKGTRK